MQSLCGAFINGVCVGDDGGCLLPNDRLKRLSCCFVRILFFCLRTVARDGHRLRISRGINRSSCASFSRRGVLSKPRARMKVEHDEQSQQESFISARIVRWMRNGRAVFATRDGIERVEVRCVWIRFAWTAYGVERR